MKLTKKLRKKMFGMNYATQQAAKDGYKPAQYFMDKDGNVQKTPGVPFVNLSNYI
jgi:hypothetical protein